MTREEAIRTLIDLQDGNGDVYEAIHMAIEALSEPSECDTCKYKDKPWDFIKCDTCTVGNSNYEPSKVDYRTDESANIGTEVNDLISRADAIDAVEQAILNHDSAIMRITSLPSAELQKGDLISRADVLKYPIRLDHYDEVNGSREFVYGVESVMEYIESLPLADAEDRLYIKIYADDEPSVKAEKLYQICGETQNREVTKWLKEYFPSADRPMVHSERPAEWIRHEDRIMIYYSCSKCGEIEIGTPPYCRKCGSYMKGGADNG